MAIQDVILPYPDFIMGEVIDPEQFDLNNSYTVGKINELLVVLNQITDSAETGSGADLIDIAPIAPFTSKKLQTYLNEVINRLKSTTAGSSGAGLIGAPPIAGVTGSTISAQLASLKTLLDTEVARITALTTRTTNVETRVTKVENDKADKATTYTKVQEDLIHNALQLELNQKGALITSLQNQLAALDNTFSTDAERIAAIQQVIAAFEASDSQLSALINNKADRANTYTKTDIDNMTLGSYAVANFTYDTVTSTVTSDVEIAIPEFVYGQDALSVFVGGTYQTIGKDITITQVGNKYFAHKISGTWNIGTPFDFLVVKNTKILTPTDQVDASLTLKNETLTKNKLAPALRNEIEAKAESTTVTQHVNDYVKHPGVASTTNTGNAYAITLDPAPTSYVNAMGLIITINANATGAATINVNGLGEKPVLKANGNPVTNFALDGVYTLRYSSVGAGSFILQGEGGEYGNVTPSDVLAGKTFGTENGVVPGTLVAFTNNEKVPMNKVTSELVKVFEKTTSDDVMNLDVDKFGNIYTIDSKGVLQKWDNNGNVLKTFQTAGAGISVSVGNNYLTCSGGRSFYKLDLELNQIWVKTIGSYDGTKSAINSNDEIFVQGITVITGGGQLTIEKWGSDDVRIWSKTGVIGANRLNKILTTSDGGFIYVLDTSQNIVKYTNLGNLEWTFTRTSVSNGSIHDITYLSNGNIAIAYSGYQMTTPPMLAVISPTGSFLFNRTPFNTLLYHGFFNGIPYICSDSTGGVIFTFRGSNHYWDGVSYTNFSSVFMGRLSSDFTKLYWSSIVFNGILDAAGNEHQRLLYVEKEDSIYVGDGNIGKFRKYKYETTIKL